MCLALSSHIMQRLLAQIDWWCLMMKRHITTEACHKQTEPDELLIQKIWPNYIMSPRFPWNKGISLPQLPFGVRSCEAAKNLTRKTRSYIIYIRVHVHYSGFGFFASVRGVFYYGGLVGWFFATVGVGCFLRQCWGGFLRQWKGFWLRQGGLFASVVVFCEGNRGLLHRHRSAAERSIKKAIFVGDCIPTPYLIPKGVPLFIHLLGAHLNVWN